MRPVCGGNEEGEPVAFFQAGRWLSLSLSLPSFSPSLSLPLCLSLFLSQLSLLVDPIRSTLRFVGVLKYAVEPSAQMCTRWQTLCATGFAANLAHL